MPATIVLFIDGISAHLPGPYGNTTVDTPSLNRLATESELFDFCFAESPKLTDSYPILWNELIGEGSLLVSDCPEVLTLGAGYPFDAIVDAAGQQGAAEVEDIADTQTANFFIHAIEALQSLESDGLCWLHHAGLTGLWDAPWSLRGAFADEDDPPPPRDVQPPNGTFDPGEIDPDILLGYQQSAYAQIVAIDQLLGVFLEQLKQNKILESVSFVFASPRGYPLGEHGIVGQFNNLYSETIHVPLMIRQPGERGKAPAFGSRHQGMVQFSQLNRMISGLLDGGFHAVPFCDLATSSVDNLKACQDGKWKLVHAAGKPETSQLFAKPDDRWDVNNVRGRCVDVAEKMLQLLNANESS